MFANFQDLFYSFIPISFFRKKCYCTSKNLKVFSTDQLFFSWITCAMNWFSSKPLNVIEAERQMWRKFITHNTCYIIYLHNFQYTKVCIFGSFFLVISWFLLRYAMFCFLFFFWINYLIYLFIFIYLLFCMRISK